ncbi:serine/threonine-protein kinase AFC2-like [Miscanthus floridulus]|uniref:serine/threonine-protein kinase AFC2-like n=1 Tax=Miscanthus floridulus TaxID=154761 RepID=UPI00345861D6
MECIAEMPRAPLDSRPRKRQRLGWDVGPAEMYQVTRPRLGWDVGPAEMYQLGLCGQEVVSAISAVALGLSSGCVSSQVNQEQPRDGCPPLREDDKDGHYVFAVGDNLTSRYKINAKMGEGTFGQVLECWDKERKEMVAIKIIRGIKKYRDAAMIEIGMLEQLCKYDESRSSCVQIRNWFDCRNHICIVFERLGPSLYDFLKKNNYRSFPIALVREIAKQLLECIAFMHELRLIHTDLKPENILLVSPEYIKVPDYKVSSRSPKEGSYYKRLPKSSAIKVIDFGSTTYDQQDQSYVVSTRHYRAPEVILGLGWSYPCDIWSVGCILVELCTGEALFQTHENLEHLAMMERVLGPLPYHMLKRADRHSDKYIRKVRLNWPEGCTSRESMKAVMKLSRLQNLVMQNVDQAAGDFIDLLQGLLKYDRADRLTAQEALRHPFFTEGFGRRR